MYKMSFLVETEQFEKFKLTFGRKNIGRSILTKIQFQFIFE